MGDLETPEHDGEEVCRSLVHPLEVGRPELVWGGNDLCPDRHEWLVTSAPSTPSAGRRPGADLLVDDVYVHPLTSDEEGTSDQVDVEDHGPEPVVLLVNQASVHISPRVQSGGTEGREWTCLKLLKFHVCHRMKTHKRVDEVAAQLITGATLVRVSSIIKT